MICTDKTGTLTENRLTVERYALPTGMVDVKDSFYRDNKTLDPQSDDLLRTALEIGVLCNNAFMGPADAERVVGDPLEIALLQAAKRAGIEREQLVAEQPEVQEEAFDSDIKMMATVHRHKQRYRFAIKGAAEAVLEAATRIRLPEGERPLDAQERAAWLAHNEEMAADGWRVMALAEKTTDSESDAPYAGLTFIGLVGLLDPPRIDVRDTITHCREAGIKVVMMTGDQPVTARNIAQTLDIIPSSGSTAVIHGRDLQDIEGMSAEDQRTLADALVFARVSPRQKLELITLHQQRGDVVAMTGDGVNDAPALKKADIGVAMGQRGTEVAREAADMVLTDDAFGRIVSAVEMGRVIFGNIRKFVIYLMSCNLSEILVVGLALGFGEGDEDVMRRPPRPSHKPILNTSQWLAIGLHSALIAAATLGGFAIALKGMRLEVDVAVTISFLTLALAQLWHVFNMRDRKSGILRNAITRNRYVWGALLLCGLLLLAAVYTPGLSRVLKLVHPDPSAWILIGAMSLVPLFIGQVLHRWLNCGKEK